MDVLTDVLHVLRFQGRLFCRMELTAPWGLIDYPPANMAQFHLVERGSCWLQLPDHPTPIPLVGGDFIMVSHSQQLILSHEPDTQMIPFDQLATGENKRIVTYGGEGRLTTLLCGAFLLDHTNEHPLFSLLPSLIHIKGSEGSSADWLSMIIKQIATEKGFEQVGAETLVGRLIDILFIHVMRHWVQNAAPYQPGWLAALGDPIVGKALELIHAAPQQAWTIEGLAQKVGLSRSAFAARFSSAVGEPPLTYLSRWRIQLAIHHMRDARNTLDHVAQMIGYDSVYSFSKAFKRQIGESPGGYRQKLA